MQTLQRILYAEDDPDIQAIVEMALQDMAGFTLLTCSTGLEAVDAAADFKPDLLLLDVMMPDLDGVAALARLREHAVTATTPVIFMTAKVSESDVAHYLSLGALGVIPKPFDTMDIAGQLRELWAQHGAQA